MAVFCLNQSVKFEPMKNLVFPTLVFLVIASCQKEPVACIEIESTPHVLKVFDEIKLKSCSEDTVWYNWEIEEYQNNAQVFQYYSEEEVTFSWGEAGTFDISLTTKSKNMKKQTSDYTQVTVTDVCYSCSNGTFAATVCYSDHEDRAGFDASLASFASEGFTCDQQ
jgi:hypothetical protein